MDTVQNWGLCTFSGGEARSPSNTMSPVLSSTSVPSGILNGKDVTVNGYWLTKLTGQSFVRRIQQAESKLWLSCRIFVKQPPLKTFWLSQSWLSQQ